MPPRYHAHAAPTFASRRDADALKAPAPAVDTSLALAGALIAWFSGELLPCARLGLLGQPWSLAAVLTLPAVATVLAQQGRSRWVGAALVASLVLQWLVWPASSAPRSLGTLGLMGLAVGLGLVHLSTVSRRVRPVANPSARRSRLALRALPVALTVVGAVPLVKLSVGAIDRARLREAFGSEADSMLVAVSALVFTVWAAGTWFLVRRNLVEPLVAPERELERLEAWADGARDGARSAWAFLASLAIGVASGLALALYLRQTR